MKRKLGDETTASMNTSEFQGESAALEEVRGATQAMPFLTETEAGAALASPDDGRAHGSRPRYFHKIP